MEPTEVMLHPSEQDSPVVVDYPSMWFQRALEDEEIKPLRGAMAEENAWLYLQVTTADGVQVAKPGDYIGIRNDGKLYVRNQ